MLSRIEVREQELERARDEAQGAYRSSPDAGRRNPSHQSQTGMEMQRGKIEQKLTGFQKLPQRHHRLHAIRFDRPG